MTVTRIGSSRLTAEVSAHGAELVALETAAGLPLLWNGDPAWWSGRAPLLFPIVGRVPDDTILVEGRRYPLKQHGFARLSQFELVEASPAACTFELRSGPQTRAQYPFAFALRVSYQIEDATLSIVAQVQNEEPARTMPFSFGFHPAFRWPLIPGTAREDYDLLFPSAEPSAIARPRDGLLAPEREPSPVADTGKLALRDAIFENGALIFDRLPSRSLRYRHANRDLLRVEFPAMPHLGVWTKPGAPFVCIEPWHGYAAPLGFAGELMEKPGIIALSPATQRAFEMRVSVVAD